MNKIMKYFEIIIPTRNRPENIKVLLNSLMKYSFKPNKIIIISSGDNIRELVLDYSKYLNIKHVHTDVYGQINQKKLGLSYISDSTLWVMFCDDDMEFLDKTLYEIDRYLFKNIAMEYSGIGVKIMPKGKQKKQFKFFRFGKLYKSGVTSNYMNSKKEIETDWLNGCSIWRTTAIRQYSEMEGDEKYSAYEDVIFSSKIALTSKLVYKPTIVIREQEQNLFDLQKYRILHEKRVLFSANKSIDSLFQLLIYEIISSAVILTSINHQKFQKLEIKYQAIKQISKNIFYKFANLFSTNGAK